MTLPFYYTPLFRSPGGAIPGGVRHLLDVHLPRCPASDALAEACQHIARNLYVGHGVSFPVADGSPVAPVASEAPGGRRPA